MFGGPQPIHRFKRSWHAWFLLRAREPLRALILIWTLTVVAEVLRWPEFYNLLPQQRTEIQEYGSSHDASDTPAAESVPAGIVKIRSRAYWQWLVARSVAGGIVSIGLLYAFIICISRTKCVVLYLRPFRVPFAHGIVTRALRSGLGRRYRMVTLDDLDFQPLEVPAAEKFVSRFGALLGIGIGLLVIGILIQGLFGIAFLIWLNTTFEETESFLVRAAGVLAVYLTIVLVVAPLSLIALRRWVRRHARLQIQTSEDLATAVAKVGSLRSIFKRPSFMAPQAVVIGTDEQMWPESVDAFTGKADAVVVDISLVRPNLVWEIQRLALRDFAGCVFIADEASLNRWLTDDGNQELKALLTDRQVLVYRPGWWNRLRFRLSLENALDGVMTGLGKASAAAAGEPRGRRVHPIHTAAWVGGLAVLAYSLFWFTGTEYAIERTVQDGNHQADDGTRDEVRLWMSSLIKAGRLQDSLTVARHGFLPADRLSDAAMLLFAAGYRTEADAAAMEALDWARKDASDSDLSEAARALFTCGRTEQGLRIAREILERSKGKSLDENLVRVLAPYGTADDFKALSSGNGLPSDRDSSIVDALLEARQFDRAIQFARGIDHAGRDAALLRIAHALANSGEVERAVKLIDGLNLYSDTRSETFFAFAAAAARHGDPQKAIALLNSAIPGGKVEYSRNDEAETRALIAAAFARAEKWADAAPMAATAKTVAMTLSGDERQKALGAVALALAEGGMAREATAIADQEFRLGTLLSNDSDWEEGWQIARMWAVLGRYDRARLAAQRSKWKSGEFRSLAEILDVYGARKRM